MRIDRIRRRRCGRDPDAASHADRGRADVLELDREIVATAGIPATCWPSAASAACSTHAFTVIVTDPGTAFDGTSTRADTSACAPGSSVSTTSDNVTHDA